MCFVSVRLSKSSIAFGWMCFLTFVQKARVSNSHLTYLYLYLYQPTYLLSTQKDHVSRQDTHSGRRRATDV